MGDNLSDLLGRLFEGSEEPPLKKVFEVMNDLVRGGLIKDYALGGAMAAMRYTEPFTTNDADIFFAPVTADLSAGIPAIFEYLKKQGYEPKGDHVVIGGFPVQFLATSGVTDDALKDALRIDFEGVQTKVFAPEYLAAEAARLGRPKDKVRLEMLLQQAKMNRKKLRTILKRHQLEAKFTLMAGTAP
jgi:hypothetical protein